MRRLRPRWSGPLGCPPGQGFFGLPGHEGSTREDLSFAVGEPGLGAGSHDRGRVIRDLAVMLADGGDWLAELRRRRSGGPVRGDRVALDGVPGGRQESRARWACSIAGATHTRSRVSASGSCPARRSG